MILNAESLRIRERKEGDKILKSKLVAQRPRGMVVRMR